MTGISRLEGIGLFTALNNVYDIVEDPGFGELCGFTEAEVTRDFEPHLEAEPDFTREPRSPPRPYKPCCGIATMTICLRRRAKPSTTRFRW